MTSDLNALSDAIIQSTTEYEFCAAVKQNIAAIKADFEKQNYSDVTVDGKTYRISIS